MPEILVPEKDSTVKMHYEIIGEGQPLIMVHGWLCSLEFWEDFYKLADEGFQLILPDLRGHGHSEPSKNVSIERLADDLNLLLETLNISQAIIIGHSMGGLVTQAFYHKYPEKVKLLGLWNTGARIPFGYGLGTSFYLFRISCFLLGLFITYPIPPLFRLILGQGWKLSFKKMGKSEAYRKLVPIVVGMKQSAVIRAAINLAKINMKNKVKDISVPTMIIHGVEDRYISPIQLETYLNENIATSELILIEEAAHFAPNEQPEIVYQHLIDFLNKEDKK